MVKTKCFYLVMQPSLPSHNSSGSRCPCSTHPSIGTPLLFIYFPLFFLTRWNVPNRKRTFLHLKSPKNWVKFIQRKKKRRTPTSVLICRNNGVTFLPLIKTHKVSPRLSADIIGLQERREGKVISTRGSSASAHFQNKSCRWKRDLFFYVCFTFYFCFHSLKPICTLVYMISNFKQDLYVSLTCFVCYYLVS